MIKMLIPTIIRSKTKIVMTTKIIIVVKIAKISTTIRTIN